MSSNNIKVSIAVVLLLFMSLNTVYSQNKKNNPFQRVSIPDSIAVNLKEAYNKNAKNVNAEANVFNLLNRKDFVFKDGIYSFQGQGPHFPKRIFIYNKGRLFIFESEGAFNPKGVIQEFADCIELLVLTDKQVVKYSQVISDYLKGEENSTYGKEVK